MRMSTLIAIAIGIAITLGGGYYLKQVGVLIDAQGPHRVGPVEPANAPLAEMNTRFDPNFSGSQDLLAHIAGLHPNMKTEDWDRALGSPPTRDTNGCKNATPLQALYLSQRQVDALRDGKINVVPVFGLAPLCLVNSSRLAIVIDEITSPTKIYRFGGHATIERLVEAAPAQLPDSFFSAAKISREDFLTYAESLANASGGHASPNSAISILLLQFDPQPPELDPSSIPGFVGGGRVATIAEINAILSAMRLEAPVYVDTRRPEQFAGDAIPGAINAAFVPSSPLQLQFQIDMPFSALAGATFELGNVPPSRSTALVLYGQNDRDPSPLWVLRQLRMMGYRFLLIAKGGLEALRQAPPATTEPTK